MKCKVSSRKSCQTTIANDDDDFNVDARYYIGKIEKIVMLASPLTPFQMMSPHWTVH